LGALLARDIFIPRAVIGALVAFIAVAAIGLERRRRGTAVLIAASIGWTVIAIATAGGEKLRGENWRSAAAAADGAGVLLVLPHAGFTPIEYYRRDVHSVPRITTRSLAVVTMSHGYTEDCSYDTRPQGVRPTAIVRGPCWRVLRYRFHERRQVFAGGASLLTR